MIKNKIFKKIFTKSNDALIVLDANLLIKDFWWGSFEYQAILNWQFLGHTPILTEITLSEASNALRKRADELLLTIESTPNDRNLDKYNRLFNRKIKKLINLESSDELIKRYEGFIRKLIKKFKGYIVLNPDVGIGTIIERSLGRIKPFNAGDKGFRDTLLWFNILELAEKYQRVSFISQNTNDFSDKLDNLHPTLLQEVKEKIPKDFEFFYFKDFNAFMKKFINDSNIRQHLVYEALYSNSLYGLDISKWLENDLIDYINEYELDGVEWTSIPYWAESPKVIKIEDILSYSFNWLEIKERMIEFYLDVSLIGHFECAVLTGLPREFQYLRQIIRHYKNPKEGLCLIVFCVVRGSF